MFSPCAGGQSECCTLYYDAGREGKSLQIALPVQDNSYSLQSKSALVIAPTASTTWIGQTVANFS
jgi:hypothetical protein